MIGICKIITRQSTTIATTLSFLLGTTTAAPYFQDMPDDPADAAEKQVQVSSEIENRLQKLLSEVNPSAAKWEDLANRIDGYLDSDLFAHAYEAARTILMVKHRTQAGIKIPSERAEQQFEALQIKLAALAASETATEKTELFSFYTLMLCSPYNEVPPRCQNCESLLNTHLPSPSTDFMKFLKYSYLMQHAIRDRNVLKAANCFDQLKDLPDPFTPWVNILSGWLYFIPGDMDILKGLQLMNTALEANPPPFMAQRISEILYDHNIIHYFNKEMADEYVKILENLSKQDNLQARLRATFLYGVFQRFGHEDYRNLADSHARFNRLRAIPMFENSHDILYNLASFVHSTWRKLGKRY